MGEQKTLVLKFIKIILIKIYKCVSYAVKSHETKEIEKNDNKSNCYVTLPAEFAQRGVIYDRASLMVRRGHLDGGC